VELRHYINLIWKWMWLLILSVVVASASSYLASKVATPLYRTKTTLMVGRMTENPDPNSVDLLTGQQLAYTYIQLAVREPVLQGVINSLSLDMSWKALAEQVSSNIVHQTMLLEINVVDSDPYRAQVLADAIAQQLILQSPTASTTNPEDVAFIQSQLDDLQMKIEDGHTEVTLLQQEMDSANSARQIQDLENQINIIETKISSWQYTYSQFLISLQGGDVNVLSIVEKASYNPSPISPNLRMNVLIAAAIGMVLAIGGALLIEYLDDTVKTPDDISRITGLATLGAITHIDGAEYPDKLVSATKPLSPIAETYRVLRTNLQFSATDNPIKSVLITSPGPREGKSVTLANLAVVIAQSGMKVILVDTDLRRPVQHKIFSLTNRHGFSDAILTPDSGFTQHLQKTRIDNLWLLSSGSLPPNPAEVLGSQRMKELIDALEAEADLVLFDSPATLVVADTAILGTRVDGIVLVTDAGHTRSNAARRAAEDLRRVKANLLGVVLNRFAVGRSDYYSTY